MAIKEESLHYHHLERQAKGGLFQFHLSFHKCRALVCKLQLTSEMPGGLFLIAGSQPQLSDSVDWEWNLRILHF